MKRMVAVGICAGMLSGCATDGLMNKQDIGTRAAVVLGGIAGSVLGKGSGRIVGAVAGVALGGFIGNQIGKMFNAEAVAAAKPSTEQRAEQQRRQVLAQREQSLGALSSMSASLRLANFITPGPLNYRLTLDNLRGARAAALINGKAVPVSMLFQADGSGRNDIPTKWPGSLKVTVPAGQPELVSSGWYLVYGQLSVPDGTGLPDAQLMAEQVYACTMTKCADAAIPEAVVDRKLAIQGGAQ